MSDAMDSGDPVCACIRERLQQLLERAVEPLDQTLGQPMRTPFVLPLGLGQATTHLPTEAGTQRLCQGSKFFFSWMTFSCG